MKSVAALSVLRIVVRLSKFSDSYFFRTLALSTDGGLFSCPVLSKPPSTSLFPRSYCTTPPNVAVGWLTTTSPSRTSSSPSSPGTPPMPTRTPNRIEGKSLSNCVRHRGRRVVSDLGHDCFYHVVSADLSQCIRILAVPGGERFVDLFEHAFDWGQLHFHGADACDRIVPGEVRYQDTYDMPEDSDTSDDECKMKRTRPRAEDFAIGWICARHLELSAARAVLDNEYEDIDEAAQHVLGRIGIHNVVIACLPAGQMGTNSAVATAAQARSLFPAVQYWLMVGIGGGVPSSVADIRLRDVVVRQPQDRYGGVIQYDLGKTVPDGQRIRTGFLNAPPSTLGTAVNKMRSLSDIGKGRIQACLSSLSYLNKFDRRQAGSDILFESSYKHVHGSICRQCIEDKIVPRPRRENEDVVIHFGLIASGNQVMKDGIERDNLSAELGGVGIKILSNTSGRENIENDPDAIELVKELDGLPLALSTAGAYLKPVTTSFSEYLRLHKESWLKLQTTSPRLISYEDRSLYTTWQITFDRIQQRNAGSAKLLKLWAYFDRQDVWFELLQQGSSADEGWIQELTEDELSFNGAVRLLCDYGLVNADLSFRHLSGSGGYSVHTCVHSWTLFVLNKEWDESLARLALTCVASKVRSKEADDWWLIQRRLLQHAMRLQHSIVADELDCKGMEWALYNLGLLYADQGKLAEAEAMYTRALQGKEEALGPKHTSTLDTVNNLGNLYKNQGKLAEAEAMYTRALQGYEMAIGPELLCSYIPALNTMFAFGDLFSQTDRKDMAKIMYTRALSGYKTVQGPSSK
ncbi:hypothetical protein GJ744_004954 [Endocarpon pusillum]|uniref:Nucleoside phosphorylase domain-containing protein n=1 Tax=Endocarpon pusillum TaxID=364733 RepID=A0A8H7DZ01_9EURO|nr:hypothetical protein GJ744_004954 [Endocarpon pusillum]